MSQKVMEQVTDHASALPEMETVTHGELLIPHEVVERLSSDELIVYNYEPRSRPRFDERMSALRLLSASRSEKRRLENSADLVCMEIPNHDPLWFPVDSAAQKSGHAAARSVTAGPPAACTATTIRALVQSVEAQTALRPQRITESLVTQIHEAEAELRAAQEEQRFLQECYDQIIAEHEQTDAILNESDRTRETELLPDAPTASSTEAAVGKATGDGEEVLVEDGAVLAEQIAASLQNIQVARLELHQQSILATKIAGTIGILRRTVKQLETDNQTNPHPIRAAFRFDVRLETPQNIQYLREMGYAFLPKS